MVSLEKKKKKKLGFSLVPIAGYVVFSLLVLVCALWFLFPGDTCKIWFESRISSFFPEVSCRIASVVPTLPPGVQLHDIICTTSDGVEQKIEQASFYPHIDSLNNLSETLKIPGDYQVRAAEGVISGTIDFAGAKQGKIQGEIYRLDLAKASIISAYLRRSISGFLSGAFSFSGKISEPSSADMIFDFTVNQGTMELRKAILGLKQLDFSSITLHCQGQRTLACDGGNFKGQQLEGEFNGEIQVSDRLGQSILHLQGELSPRPELLAGLGNKQEANLLRSQLKNGKLPFSLQGSLENPGISFSSNISDQQEILRKAKGIM